MRKKSYSSKHLFLVYYIIFLSTLIGGMLITGGWSMWSSVQQISSVNRSVLHIYIAELETQMDALTALNQDIYSNNYAFQTLAAGRYQAGEKPRYEYELLNMIKNSVPAYGAILIFDSENKISVCRSGSGYGFEDTLYWLEMKEQVKEYCQNSTPKQMFRWQIVTKDQRALLLNVHGQQGLYICDVIDLGKFIRMSRTAEENTQLFTGFFNETEILYLPDTVRDISKEDLIVDQGISFILPGYMLQTLELKNAELYMCCIMPLEYLWEFSRVSLAMIAIISLCFTFLIIFIFSSIKKVMVYPLEQIAAASERLQKQESLSGKKNSNRITELQKIHDALEQLVEQKITLEKENLTRQQEKEKAQLQYFQLQTRPHFFLNCLKSLYNMLENKEYSRMQRMILAFSNHLRYIFHDTLTLVSLKAELEEVSDYYNIILLDRYKPIILTTNVDDTLLQEQIPPLLIQTFLENSIKYNGKNEKALRFMIQIDTIILENRRFMRIRLSDNGIGYSRELLEKFNNPEIGLYEKYHIGISNLKRRLQLIYQNHFQITFYNEPAGGACVLLCLPLDEKSIKKE